MIRRVLLLASVVTALDVSQYNLTLSFQGVTASGRFANGDFWVQVPPTGAQLFATAPAFNGMRNGFERNCDSIFQQGFDSRIAGWNASRVPALPLSIRPGDRIVKAESVLEAKPDHSVALQTAIVVTAVSAPPPPGAFRPPYFGATVTGAVSPGAEAGYWMTSQMNLSRLQASPAVPSDASVIPSFDWVTTRFERIQLDHLVGYVSRQLHPVLNMPNYGADIARDTGDGAMRLMLPDAPLNASSKPAAVAYVQMGLDIYSILANGGAWPANGGHENGRKLPLAFAGVVLADSNVTDACERAGVATFSESDETRHSPANADLPLFGQVNEAPERVGTTEEEAYWQLVTSGDGFRTGRDPYGWIDGGAFPGSYYQFCCTSEMWKGTALPIGNLSAPLRAVANLPFFLEYVDRWVSFGAWAQPDPCAPPTGTCTDGSGACKGPLNSACGDAGNCTLSMAGYGKDFGPDGKGSCIKDTDPGDGTGRFPALHGSAKDQGDYESQFAAAMWQAQL
jgi:hypothetical protein